MREQLSQYVSLLFAGAQDCQDIRQEILQNTLDRYDDLIAQGKAPEAAYRLAISGIGDINEILGQPPQQPNPIPTAPASDPQEQKERKTQRAVAVGMYITCIIPLIILSEFGLDTLGLCLTLLLVAAATVLMVQTSVKGEPPRRESAPLTPRQELRKSIRSLIWTLGTVAYFVISFATSSWHISWLIFPITAAVSGLTKAILDYMEVSEYEA